MTSELIEDLAEGIEIPCELKVPKSPPIWLDKEKYERGRDFFKQNPFSVLVSNYCNLVVGLSVSNLCDVLVLTQKSETKKKAFFRYIDTGYYMSRFLQGPAPWENDNIFHIVNQYHSKAAEMARKMTKNQRHQAAKDKLEQLKAEDKIPLNDEFDQALMSDLEYYKTRVFQSTSFPIFDKYMRSDVIFSQFDMAMVQIAFFASVVIFPQ